MKYEDALKLDSWAVPFWLQPGFDTHDKVDGAVGKPAAQIS